MNAVVHRDYARTGSQVLFETFEDRIAITSPGTLPNHMTVDQARSGGAPRGASLKLLALVAKNGLAAVA